MTWMENDGTIYHVKSDDFELTLEDFQEDGVDIDWTGWKVLFQAREIGNSSRLILEIKEDSEGVDLSNPGIMILTKDKSSFTNLEPKEYEYGLKLIRPNGKDDTFLPEYKFVLLKGVAR